MNLSSRDLIFDTVVDTTKLFVSVKNYFTILVYKNRPQIGHVYLFATGNKQRVRINIDLEVAAVDWNLKPGDF